MNAQIAGDAHEGLGLIEEPGFGGIDGPAFGAGMFEGGAEGEDLAEAAGGEDFLGAHVRGHETLVQADHEKLVVLFGGGHHRPGVFAGGRHRLFAQNVLAGIERFDAHGGVRAIGAADDHGVDIGGFEEIVVVGEGGGAVLLAEGLSAARGGIGDRDDAGVTVAVTLGEVAALSDGTAADDAVLHGHKI